MILCCGEALIDMIPEQTVSGRNAFVPHAGGAVYNTAIALGRLGAPVGLLTGLSDDMFGQQLRAGLDASHVGTNHVITSARPTTLAFVQLEDGHASYDFFDEGSAGRMLTSQDMPLLGDDVSALFFGGISLAIEPAADAYANLLERTGDGKLIMMDPNIRPGFIVDETRYRDRLNRMFSSANILKVSDEDLNWLIPGPESFAEKAGLLLSKGPALVIVTEGSKGATGYSQNGECVTVAAEMVKVVDTVGAGDSYNAGVLVGLSRCGLLSPKALGTITPEQIEAAMCFGARIAAITVSRSGANPPWVEEL